MILRLFSLAGMAQARYAKVSGVLSFTFIDIRSLLMVLSASAGTFWTFSARLDKPAGWSMQGCHSAGHTGMWRETSRRPVSKTDQSPRVQTPGGFTPCRIV